MSEYANIKRKKVKSLLNWLSKKSDIEVVRGGKHYRNIKYAFQDRPFPISFKHNEINKHIIKDLVKRLVNSGICTGEEIDKKIK